MVKGTGVRYIAGWGDTKDDCAKYLAKHPELKRQGYKVARLGNTWVIMK